MIRLAVNSSNKLINIYQLVNSFANVNDKIPTLKSAINAAVKEVYQNIGYDFLGEFILYSNQWQTAVNNYLVAGTKNVVNTSSNPYKKYYLLSIPGIVSEDSIDIVFEYKSYNFKGSDLSVNIYTDTYNVIDIAEIYNFTVVVTDENNQAFVCIRARDIPTANLVVRAYKKYIL